MIFCYERYVLWRNRTLTVANRLGCVALQGMMVTVRVGRARHTCTGYSDFNIYQKTACGRPSFYVCWHAMEEWRVILLLIIHSKQRTHFKTMNITILPRQNESNETLHNCQRQALSRRKGSNLEMSLSRKEGSNLEVT